MSYLHPPPGPAPVVIQRDVGGLVADYQRQTELYRRDGREVRLHECRSACTLALSLPNVCVYPASVLRFHQAYNRDTKQVDQKISDDLFSSYPEPVRRRLGYLTRQYRSLSGSELIDLGVRNCNETPVMFARRKQGQGATQIASAAPAAGAGQEPGALTRLAGRLSAVFSAQAEPSQPQSPAAAPRPQAQPAALAQANVPLPPVRPAGLVDPTPTASIPAETVAPLPPIRPVHLGMASVRMASAARAKTYSLQGRLPTIITGAWPVLPASFSAYAPMR